MSKITFRAADDLVERLEACDASKSEVMREALRTHLADDPEDDTDAGSLEAILADRVDELIEDRLDAVLASRGVTGPSGARPPDVTHPSAPGDVTVNVTLDAPGADIDDARVTRDGDPTGDPTTRKTQDADPEATPDGQRACVGCGEHVPDGDVYCPNCGEKQSHRAFCECGDEVRTDWAFCPGCGRRTPAADVLHDR